MDQLQRQEIYRHYKGNFYKFICCATNASNPEGDFLVIYQNLEGRVFSRPYEEFDEIITIKNHNGEDAQVRRFQLVPSYFPPFEFTTGSDPIQDPAE